MPIPWYDAFWDGTGHQVIYGEGIPTADDAVAHEWTHGVIQFSADLVGYMQPGALSESFADIFGETVDLTNRAGTDTATKRWLIGEDLPRVGVIRNMRNPKALGDPGKVSDPQFVCTNNLKDGGGIQNNNGVPNHAYVLMVDGGTYNGIRVTGMGLTKAGKIQYRALTRYLTSGSDFLDNYHALQQACADLIGIAGITRANCTQVKRALDAVEMFLIPCNQPQVPPLCPVGQVPRNLFVDTLENITSGNWFNPVSAGVNHWDLCDGIPDIYCDVYATSRRRHFWGGGYNVRGASAVAMTRSVSIPASRTTYMQFNHAYEFEEQFDGGVIEYSTNGGTRWSDARGLIAAGATYDGTLSTAFRNPLGGRQAFTRNSFGYTATQLSLSSLVHFQ